MTRKHWKYILLHIERFNFFSFSEYFKVGSTKIWVFKCFNYLGALFTLLFLETKILALSGSLILAYFTLPDSEVARHSRSCWARRRQVPCSLWNMSLGVFSVKLSSLALMWAYLSETGEKETERGGRRKGKREKRRARGRENEKNLMTSHPQNKGILGDCPDLGGQKRPRWPPCYKNSSADSSQKNVTAGSGKQLE